RGHVIGSPEYRVGGRLHDFGLPTVMNDFGYSEIEYLDQFARATRAYHGQEDVRGLEISVDDASGVRFDHRRGRLHDVVDRVDHIEALVDVELGAQIVTGKELEHDVREPARKNVHVVDTSDVEAAQQRCGLRLALETVEQLRVRGDLGAQDLDGEALSQAQM